MAPASLDEVGRKILNANTKEYGMRVRKLRERDHMTQQHLADRLGISKQGLSKIESGKIKRIERKYFDIFQEVFHCTQEYLLGVTEGPDTMIGKVKDEEKELVEPIYFDEQAQLKREYIEMQIHDEKLYKLMIKAIKSTEKSQTKRDLLVEILKIF